MSRRSRFEIYVDTLREIKSGTNLPTNIMFGTKTNWNTIKKTLMELTAKGFIEEHQMEDDKRTKNIYTLTEKGDNVLKYFNMIKDILEPPETVDIPV